MKSKDKLLEFISKNRQSISPLLILTHDFPDPDAIGAAYALYFLAKHFGVRSKIVYGGFISRLENRYMVDHLKIPLHRLAPSHFNKYRHIALVDTQPGFGNNSLPAERRAAIVIDQHPYVSRPSADLVIIETNRGATCEILAEAILSLKVDIPSNITTALVYGILTDTFNLYRVPSRRVFTIYQQLLPLCDMKKLASLQNPAQPAVFFSTISRAIQGAAVQGSLIYCHLGIINDPVFTAHVADFLLTYKGTRWSFCTGRHKDRLCVSLRSAGNHYDASDVLRDVFDNRAQAGGHGAIAGGSIDIGAEKDEDAWRKAEQKIVKRLMKRLRLSTKNEAHNPFAV